MCYNKPIMKILITTDLFTTATNGVVTSVKNLQNELKDKGHDVRILTISDSIHSHKSYNIYYIRSMPFAVYPDVRMPISYRHPLIKELVEWKPDIIHSQCEFFSLTFAKYIAKHTGAPIVHTYHTLYEQYVSYLIPGKRLGKQVVKVVSKNRLKKVKTVIAPTHKVETALHSYGIDKSISVIPSGISLTQHNMRLSEEQLKQKKLSLGIEPTKTILLNLGRLGTEKNLEELLKLFSIAVTKYDNLVFLIVGDGPDKERLEKLSDELGVSDHVIFTGMVAPSEVQEYYQMGDIFVSASTSETQGLTYIEAAANGLPLLCRQDLCLQDVVVQGKNGYTYTTASEFLKYLGYILKDAAWRKEANVKSKEIANAFDKSAFGSNIEQLYMSVINEHK